ncbi:hypothetical protein FSS13T_01390 [Flavobacterium saliperosum S13]|uniref:Site-specific DNA recombinase n=2 Tax=Flavobacterium saliperosum TaxID=329186 RepID=A0A1G4V304_9FLAO|nr:recombinase family protein [Flavobacterium saliperosum]ESU27666.1 hypothetical protein FSS13T_01390 [Flavobacterium saliperosum S13]SCX00353.1 Site-specific DNA recombinase [Flavobacterium saliperosum]
MEKAIIIARCSTNENKQDVSRQSKELRKVYGGQYEIVKEFTYYKSGTANDDINDEILDFAIKNNIRHIIALEISRISRKISSFALFLEKCNEHKINIIIDNFKLHTLLPSGETNSMVQTMLSIASTFANLELSLIKERLNSGRSKFINEGGKLGRKVGYRKSNEAFIEENKDVIKFLRQEQSIRNIMKLTGKSCGTIQKVKRLVA